MHGKDRCTQTEHRSTTSPSASGNPSKKAGRTYKEIGEIIGVQPTTVCQWYKAYQSGGAKAIRIKKRGRPVGKYRTLSPEQEKEIQKSIRDNCPDQLKLPFALWTRIAVQQLIKQLGVSRCRSEPLATT